ncbi:MAG TPA: hypothetical protein VFV38_00680 [Ktedonobacteraceae bacterium]|nr:hypothetical protein [Ktedonobacteraceae bacterium]
MTTDNPTVPSEVPSLPDAAPDLRYQEIKKKLIEPLPSHLIKVRPGATTRDKKKAIALAYYDWRIMVNRLDRLVGGENWYARLQPWGDHKIICTLTILGIPKDSSGEGDAEEENDGTSAEQQAKKRAMAEHGLNYLYLLPRIWGDYDAEKKSFVNPQALVEEMYRNARIEGLDLLPYISSTRKSSGRRASTSTGSSTAAETVPPIELITEKTAATPPVDDKIIQAIRKLCGALGKAEPEYATLTPESAQQLRNQLFNEAKATRARSTAVPASTR